MKIESDKTLREKEMHKACPYFFEPFTLVCSDIS